MSTDSAALVCWRCGNALGEEPLPLARSAQCRQCRADLHVCRLCKFHARGVANECREPIAERVVDKTRANFCGYFTPRPGAYAAATDDGQSAAALAALFGEAPATEPAQDAARSALDALFRKE